MLSGKKKSERKARQLLSDLPLPPELPGGTSSPHSPPEDKKTLTLRKRPKYVTLYLMLHINISSATVYCVFTFASAFSYEIPEFVAQDMVRLRKLK